MKSIVPILFLLLLASAKARPPAPTAADNFNDSGIRSGIWTSEDFTIIGHFLQHNQRLEFMAPANGGIPVFATRSLKTGGPFTRKWEATVDVHNAAVVSSADGEANLTLGLGGSSGHALDLQFVSYKGERRIQADMYLTNRVGARIRANVFSTDVSLKFAFDEQTRVVNCLFDPDGSLNGPQWQSLGSYGLGGAGGSAGNVDLPFGPWDYIRLTLSGAAYQTEFSHGVAYFDNFRFNIIDPPLFINLVGKLSKGTEGGRVTFGTQVQTTTTTTFQWYKGSLALQNGADISGARTAMLTLANLRLSDGGEYRLEATNDGGKTEEMFMLEVGPVPPVVRVTRPVRLASEWKIEFSTSRSADCSLWRTFELGVPAERIRRMYVNGNFGAFFDDHSADGAFYWITAE